MPNPNPYLIAYQAYAPHTMIVIHKVLCISGGGLGRVEVPEGLAPNMGVAGVRQSKGSQVREASQGQVGRHNNM